MKATDRWDEPPRPCSYSPGHLCELEYVCVAALGRDEYMTLLAAGWRRFGHTIFRQRCSGPGACRSLRVDVARFRPNRSQRRARKHSEGIVSLSIGAPAVRREKVELFDKFHAERSLTRNWPRDLARDADEYERTFVANPFPTQEWCYYSDHGLVGVGYVDVLAGGLSAIYFARDPGHREGSLGTWNVLNLIDRAKVLGLPHVYLGYHSQACISLRYKGSFRPNQSLDLDGQWREGER